MQDIILDSNDNVYVFGSPIVAKFNSSLIFQSTIAYQQGDYPRYYMAVDSHDNIYIVSTIFVIAQGYHIRISKYGSSLALISDIILDSGTDYSVYARAIDIDRNDNIFVAGYANIEDILWIGKFNSSLSLLESSTFDTADSNNFAEDIDVDDNGDVWVVGGDSGKGWLGKYNNSLILQSSQTITKGLGLTWNNDSASHVTVDTLNGNVWSSGCFAEDIYENYGGWISKYDFSFTFISGATFYSYYPDCHNYPISVDGAGNLWAKSGETLIKYNSSLDIISSIALSGLRNLYVDSSGKCWAIGNSGEDMWVTIIEDVYPPPSPFFTEIFSGISSITWNWSITLSTSYYDDATSYYVIDENSQSVSPVLSSSTLSWTEIGLSTNTAYTRAVVAANQ
ncbi:MAG: SBBP repeat-containing protein, partial [Elusimicrobia bacterium]|nr:SBBP repeat-containing protein [Elusimicrobiota bacterium]